MGYNIKQNTDGSTSLVNSDTATEAFKLNLDDSVDIKTMLNFTTATASDKIIEVPDVVSAGVLAAHITDAMTHSIRIQSADGTSYYIMCTTTVTNRTGGG